MTATELGIVIVVVAALATAGLAVRFDGDYTAAGVLLTAAEATRRHHSHHCTAPANPDALAPGLIADRADAAEHQLTISATALGVELSVRGSSSLPGGGGIERTPSRPGQLLMAIPLADKALHRRTENYFEHIADDHLAHCL